MNLPIAFVDKMKNLLGDEFDDYIKCYDEKRLYGLRVNTKKISVEEFKAICPFEIQPIPWIENGFYYDGDTVQAAKHPYYFAGLYYLQEPSAMTPANRLPIEPGDKVLDVCAAPGGKATELGAKLDGTGVLMANDISNSRAKGLLKNIEVFGIGNVLVLSEEPGKLESYFPEYFDKILDNFRRQKLYHKELIVVFHCSNKPSAGEIRQMMAKALPEEQIQIFWRNSASISFGYCINEGVSLTNMEFVAKFDDDDFYGDNFLTDIVPAFSYTDADVCGRISFHTYLEETESLIIRKPGNEYMYCKFLPGATIVARRSVFEKTLFRDIPRDIDGKFGVDCTEAGVKMFAVDTFQLLVMRASDKSKHTWKASDSVILKQSLPAHPDIDTDLETYSAYYKPFFPSITKEKAKKMISV